MLKLVDVIILCGGKGTRVQHLHPDIPKPLFPVGGKPFLDHLIDFFYHQGLRRFILSTGHLGEKIRLYYQNHPLKRRITISQEPSELLGTAGAVKFASKFIRSQHFLVANGDSLCRIDFYKFITVHLQSKSMATIAAAKSNKRIDAGNIHINSRGQVTSFIQKGRKTKYINAGFYLFRKDIFSFIPEGEKCSLEYDIFPKLAETKKISAFPIEDKVYDIGTQERLTEFSKSLKNTYVQK